MFGSFGLNVEPLYQYLSERLQRNHEMWLARGGNSDGVSLDAEEEPLPVTRHKMREKSKLY